MSLVRLSLAPLLLAGAAAHAQAVADEADDAFGRRVGNESIGLYSEVQVRGFNLQNAGNYRIEGAYFARAVSPEGVLRRSTVTRIGVNALRYDFPSPSGVVDYELFTAPPGTAATAEVGTRLNTGPYAELSVSSAPEDGKFGIFAAVNLSPFQRYNSDSRGDYFSGGLVARWKPVEALKITALASASTFDAEVGTSFVTKGSFAPPEVKRGVFRAERWSLYQQDTRVGGLIAESKPAPGWTLQGAGFVSASLRDRSDAHFLFVNEDGSYDSTAILVPRETTIARSASMLGAHEWQWGRTSHRAVATVRYRETDATIARASLFVAAPGNLADPYRQSPEPEISFDPARADDHVRQWTGGVGYRFTLGDTLELRGDVSKTDYQKERIGFDGIGNQNSSAPWLYSASALLGVTDRLTVFSSYSRGLEESGTAPADATNRGEVLPAVIATQRELGFRYGLAERLSLIGGLFDTRKQAPGYDLLRRFGLVGEVRHRGIEASLAGQLTPRLSIVAGLVVLDATLSGPLVDAGLIGREAVGRPSHVGLLNLTWRVPGVEGLSIDGRIYDEGSRVATVKNDLSTPGFTSVDLGMRYQFNAGRVPLVLRLRVGNIFDNFDWIAYDDRSFSYQLQRSVAFSIRATL